MPIVCGTDFSPNAAHAADAAAAVAAALGAPLHLAHVVDAFWPELPEALQSPLLDEIRRRLGAERQRLRQRGITVEETVLYGMADEALVSHAEAQGARLLVVSSSGRRAPARWLLGSVAERTAQTSSIPVVVVRNAAPFLDWTDGTQRLRVMVGADFSITADAAIAWIAELRAIGPCDVIVAYSSWPPGERERLGGERGASLEDPAVDAAVRRDLEEKIGRLPDGAGTRIRVERTLGRAASHLVGMAIEEGVHLLVVGTHQRTGVSQLWHGSVSRGVLHEAPMSVACVPAPRPPRDETPG